MIRTWACRRAHQHVGDFQRLFTGIGLGDQELIEVHAEQIGVLRIECMFGIHESGRTAGFLDFGDDMQGERGLARGLRSVDFHDPTPGQAADAQGQIQSEGASRHGNDIAGCLAIAHAHDRALAKLFFDLTQCGRQGLLAILVHPPLALTAHAAA